MSDIDETTTPETKNEDDDEESEYEEVDLSENPMYQVLSTLLENENGDNVVDMLERLVMAVNRNTDTMAKLYSKNSKNTNCKCDPCKCDPCECSPSQSAE